MTLGMWEENKGISKGKLSPGRPSKRMKYIVRSKYPKSKQYVFHLCLSSDRTKIRIYLRAIKTKLIEYTLVLVDDAEGPPPIIAC